jgi:hypothetical protein
LRIESIGFRHDLWLLLALRGFETVGAAARRDAIVRDENILCDNFQVRMPPARDGAAAIGTSGISSGGMKPILNLFWQICLLRQSPAYVPTYGWFVGLVVLANVVCSTLVSASLDAEFELFRTLTSIIVGQSTTAVLVMLALMFKNLGQRFVTTITAIFGCDLLITASFAVMLPLAALLGEAAVSLALVAFLIWSVAVAGFILHRALQAPLAMGIGVAMGISLMSVTLGRVAIGQ